MLWHLFALFYKFVPQITYDGEEEKKVEMHFAVIGQQSFHLANTLKCKLQQQQQTQTRLIDKTAKKT